MDSSSTLSVAKTSAAWLAVGTLLFFAAGIRADTQSSSLPSTQAAPKDTKAELNSVTVEAQRERKALEHQVDAFVFSVIVRHTDDNEGLARWNEPICPFVDGLLEEQSKFVLARLSAIVASAGARLGPEHCRPNFYVVATPEPDQFLKRWYARDPKMFNHLHGRAPLKSFLTTPRPVRVWYNRDFASGDGLPAMDQPLQLAGGTGPGTGATATAENTYPVIQLHKPGGTRLEWDGVQNLSLVIAVIDTARIKNLSVGQLADYVGMVGLAEVHLDAQVGSTPSILQLFSAAGDSSPHALSSWDEAFLKSVYDTNQRSVVQLQTIEEHMTDTLAH
jgi:hypothetical protein